MSYQIRVISATVTSVIPGTLSYNASTTVKNNVYKTSNQGSANQNPLWSGAQTAIWTFQNFTDRNIAIALNRVTKDGPQVVGLVQLDMGAPYDFEERIITLDHPLYSIQIGVKMVVLTARGSQKPDGTEQSIAEPYAGEESIAVDEKTLKHYTRGGDRDEQAELFGQSAEESRPILPQLAALLEPDYPETPIANFATYFQSTLQITDLPPIPTDTFLDQMFNFTIDSLGISPGSSIVSGLTKINKWMYICQHGLDSRNKSLKPNSVEFWVDGLINHPDQKYLDDFLTQLQSADGPFVDDFCEQGIGALVQLLAGLLGNMEFDTLTVQFLSTLIKIFIFLMKDMDGTNACLADPNALNLLMLCFYRTEISCTTKEPLLEVFTVISLIPHGNRQIFAALEYLQEIYELQDEFVFLLELIDHDDATPQFQTLSLCFINALLSSSNLQRRLALRNILQDHKFGELVEDILESVEDPLSTELNSFQYQYESFVHSGFLDHKEKNVLARGYPGVTVPDPYRLASELIVRAGRYNLIHTMVEILEGLHEIIVQDVHDLQIVIKTLEDLTMNCRISPQIIKASVAKDALLSHLYQNRQLRREECVQSIMTGQITNQNVILQTIMVDPNSDNADSEEELSIDDLLEKHTKQALAPLNLKPRQRRHKPNAGTKIKYVIVPVHAVCVPFPGLFVFHWFWMHAISQFSLSQHEIPFSFVLTTFFGSDLK